MKHFILIVVCITLLNASNIDENKTRDFKFAITHEYLSEIKGIKSSFYKRAAINRLKSYVKLLKDIKPHDTYKKVYRVNAFFNKFMYKEDMDNYGQEDYWSTVQEFLLKGSGDCEDYAIAKYITLVNLGIPKENLTLVLSKYKSKKYSKVKKLKNEYHMVLLYKVLDKTFVLDSNNYNIMSKKLRNDLNYIKEIKI